MYFSAPRVRIVAIARPPALRSACPPAPPLHRLCPPRSRQLTTLAPLVFQPRQLTIPARLPRLFAPECADLAGHAMKSDKMVGGF